MKKSAILFIIIAGVLWGSMGLFVRTLTQYDLTSMDIVGLRAIVTMMSMFLFLFIGNRKLLRIKLKDIWCFFGTGICSIVFFNFCYFKAITLTSLSVAAVLLYTAPAIVMVLSAFLFKERITKKKLCALLMTFLGCLLVTGIFQSAHAVTTVGILYGMGAGFGYALYSIFSRFALKKGYHSMTITFYTFLVAAIATLFLANPRRIVSVATTSVSMSLFSIAFGILCTVIPYLTYTMGLKYVENTKASIIASVEPVTAAILGVVVFKESISLYEIIGILMVLSALVLCADKPQKN